MKYCSVGFVALAILLLTPAGGAHDIITTNLTYTRDISRIITQRCAACHSAGSSIPLTSYAEVRPWAVDIKEQVLSRQMPPWGAVKGFGDLSPDEGLTQEELLIVAAWVVGGAPQGNPALLSAAGSRTSPATAPAQRSATESAAPLRGATLLVTDNLRLAQSLSLAAIRPLNTQAVESARITATLPDGEETPLLWLSHYDPKWKQTFHFRSPVNLPPGSTIQSDSPLQFALELR